MGPALYIPLSVTSACQASALSLPGKGVDTGHQDSIGALLFSDHSTVTG
jgi:hypothetical protein